MKLKELRAQRYALQEKGRAIIEAAENSEDGALTDDQETELKQIEADVKALGEKISEAEKLSDRLRNLGTTGQVDVTSIEVIGDRIEADPRRGFKHFGEFARAVYVASAPGRHGIDERLKIGAAPTTYGSEGVGEDGGFLVPPEFAAEIRQHSLEQGAFLPLCDNDQVTGNGMTYPVDETVPWAAGGVQAYWEAEAAQATQTKPQFKQKQLRLNKMIALVPVTDELLADAAALATRLPRLTGRAIQWKTNDGIMNGSGAGQPLGIVNSGCLVVQAKEGSQAAATVVAGNIAKMFSRCTNPGAAVWVMNNDVYPQLITMTIANQPIFVAPGGIGAPPGGSLLGRPVMMSQTCQTLGTQNDIVLCDFSSYITNTKAGGIDYASSIHLFFDYAVTAFRAVFRVDGQPWPSSAITPNNGTATLSPFVSLAVRA